MVSTRPEPSRARPGTQGLCRAAAIPAAGSCYTDASLMQLLLQVCLTTSRAVGAETAWCGRSGNVVTAARQPGDLYPQEISAPTDWEERAKVPRSTVPLPQAGTRWGPLSGLPRQTAHAEAAMAINKCCAAWRLNNESRLSVGTCKGSDGQALCLGPCLCHAWQLPYLL